MKYFYLYLLALLGIASLTSCSKDYYEPEEIPRPRPVPSVQHIPPPVDDI